MSGIAAGVELVGSVGTGAVASVMAGSGDTGRAGVAGAVGAVPDLAEAVACAGTDATLPVLAKTESGDSVRAGVVATRGSTAGLRADVDVDADADAGDELDAVGCTGIGVGVPDLGGAELGGGDLVGVTTARTPSAGLRLGPMPGIGPGVTVCVGAGGVVGIREETGRAACVGAI